MSGTSKNSPKSGVFAQNSSFHLNLRYFDKIWLCFTICLAETPLCLSYQKPPLYGKILLLPLINLQNHFVKTLCAVGIDFEKPRFHSCFWPNSKVVLLRFLLFLFCSTSLPLTSTRRFDQHIQAFPHSNKCCGLISTK